MSEKDILSVSNEIVLRSIPQAIAWANVDANLSHHSQGHNGLLVDV